jgi:hypothetical protein
VGRKLEPQHCFEQSVHASNFNLNLSFLANVAQALPSLENSSKYHLSFQLDCSLIFSKSGDSMDAESNSGE